MKEASAILDGKHYLGGLEYSPRFCIATPDHKSVAIFADPIAHHFKRELNSPLELTRLWQADGVRTPVSQFLAAALRWLKKLAPESDCVFSYADPRRKNRKTGRNHRGTVYQACNFAYLGTSRATDYWRKPSGELVSSPVCYRLFKTKSREKIRKLQPRWRLIEGQPKHLYVFGLKRTADAILASIRGRYNSKQPFPKLRGVGRPKGREKVVSMTLPAGIIARVDEIAKSNSTTRAQVLRLLIGRQFRAHRDKLAAARTSANITVQSNFHQRLPS